MTDLFHERLASLTEDAGLAMSRLAGGAAVCTFSRAGIAVPGIKYAEGRWAALREVHRRASTAEPDVAAQVLTSWRAELAAVEQREAGRDWIAYRTGGVDALTELLDVDA